MTVSVPPAASRDASLAILATSDLHCDVNGWDYLADGPAAAGGLHRLAPVIARIRAEVANTLLLDNGDLLQGNLLADEAARRLSQGDLPPGAAPHPAVEALDRLGYDAAGLGNHDFDFGLDVLRRAIEASRHPVLCTNVTRSDGTPFLPRRLILERDLGCDDGLRRRIRIGVISLVPAQTAHWNQHHVEGRLHFEDMLDSARAEIAQLRPEVDLVIALAHTGLGTDLAEPTSENVGHALSALPGLDALILGHSHLPYVASSDGPARRLATVLPGPQGAQLGVIRLRLRPGDAGWSVIAAQAALVPGEPAPPKAEGPDHEGALALARRPVARLERTLSTRLALVSDCAAVRLVAEAQRAHVARALAGTPEAALPLLSAAAPFRTGGRGGPGNFTTIPAGPLHYRHVADLYPFRNRLVAMRVTGAAVLQWLERVASVFHRIRPGVRDQPLVDTRVPPWTFETIFGLTYRIDATRPPAFDAAGRPAGGGGRITDLRHDGRPVAPDDAFVIATNSYRAAGGPASPAPGHTIYRSAGPARDLLAEEFGRLGQIDGELASTWDFAPIRGATALFDTSPDIAADREALRRVRAEVVGPTPEGFLRLRLPLDTPIPAE